MSDPLSVTASLVGVVGALLHGSKRLFEFIDSLRNAPKDISALSTDLRALYEVLAQLTRTQERLSGNPNLCSSLKAPLENCLDIFDEFTTLLQGFTQTSRDGSIKVRTWKNIVWAFKDKEIQLFRDTITTYKVSLDMAVNSMAFSTITSIEERTRRFETDFKEEFRDIKARLRALDVDRIELASISGCKGSEWYGTEADFALNRFLDYSESLCVSPPGSFPGSPILPASESYLDLDTSGGTLDSMSELQDGQKHGDTTQSFILQPKPPGPSLPILVDRHGSPPLPVSISEPLSRNPLSTLPLSQIPLSHNLPPALSLSQTPLSRDASAAHLPPLQELQGRNQSVEKRNVKSAHNESEFDVLRALWLVTTRKNPKIKLAALDMSCSFVICDTTLDDCPVVYVSDNFQNLTGYSRSEVHGKNCRFLQAPDRTVEAGSNREFVESYAVYNLKKNVEERNECLQSLMNYRKGGEPFLNLLAIIPIPWDSDESRYYIGLQVNIVENPNAISPFGESGEIMVSYTHSDIGQYVWTSPVQALLEPESDKTLHVNDVSLLLQQFKSHRPDSTWYKQSWDLMLLENTDDLIYVLSPEMLFLYLSPACKRLLEYDSADLVGTSLSGICHPSDIETVTHELADKASHGQFSTIFRIRRRSSGYMWFESCGWFSVEPDNGRSYLTLIGRHYPIFTLSRRELESNGGVVDRELWTKISTSGILLFVPSNVQELLDLHPETLIGTRIQDLVPKMARSEFDRMLEKARQGKTMVFEHEFQISKGQVIQVQTILYPGKPFLGSKPAFLLAQTKLSPKSPPRTSEGVRSTTSQDKSLELGDDIFTELQTLTMFNWHAELRRVEEENHILAKDLDRLLLKVGRTSRQGNFDRRTGRKNVPIRTKRSFDQLN